MRLVSLTLPSVSVLKSLADSQHSCEGLYTPLPFFYGQTKDISPNVQAYRVLEGFRFTVALDQQCGSAVASWLVRSTPARVVWVRVLAAVIVLYSKATHFTFTVLLLTQVYKW